jgi:signal transduction histidine kinase
MRNALLTGFDPKRLRALLAVFFLALLVPTGFLIYQSYDQLKWEAFHQHRVMAEELAARIDAGVTRLIATEEARAYSDYSFLVIEGDPTANFLQRSPLSSFPVAVPLPGLIGYFQVDADGWASTPLLPPPGTDHALYGISASEYDARLALQRQIQQVLSENRLVRAMPRDLPRSPETAPEIAPEPEKDSEALASATLQMNAVEESVRAMPESAALKRETRQEVVRAPQAFDRLDDTYAQRSLDKTAGLGRVEDLKLDAPYENRLSGLLNQPAEPASAPQARDAVVGRRAKRREQTVLPEPAPAELRESVGGTLTGTLAGTVTVAGDFADELAVADADAADFRSGKKTGNLVVNTFESEIDPFQFDVLDDGHLVLHRNVWRDGQRITQGALLARRPFIDALIQRPFQETGLSAMSDLIVALYGDVVRTVGAQGKRNYVTNAVDLTGALLYSARLSEPLGALELIFTVTRLPVGPGGSVVVWVSVVLGLVLVGGFVLIYRLGLGQINLNRQQQDFVSAVSHELKTPLTSIRMYGEMLQAGWADEDKKQSYYDFICEESERLSRLITNVLQLAQLTRNDPQFDLKPVSVAQLLDMTESKIASQVERAGFELRVARDAALENVKVLADSDCFSQVMINLVDNALKFAGAGEQPVIEIGTRASGSDGVCFTVRDHGPGVPNDQMKKIFRLFYRTESELTRETVGTGIGLALVHQLVLAMRGSVDVRNREPGAEFRVTLTRVLA